jgi:glycosyltransferase involved in cell wall biosynthesis
LRVCFVASNSFALNAFLASPIEALAAAGWKITVALNTQDGDASEAVRRHAEVVPLAIQRDISPLADVPVLRALTRLCRRQRFDVIHSITPKAGVLAMTAGLLGGVPVRMHTFTGQVWATRRGPMRAFLKLMERYVAGCATHVLADSRSQAEFMVAHGSAAADRIEVLGAGSICGVDTQRFRPRPEVVAEVRGRLGIPADAVVVLFLGRLHPEKGLAELGRAFEHVAAHAPQVHLLVVGPDEGGLGLLKQGIVQAAGRVHVVGRTPEPEIYMAAADLLCLPSYREGFALSLLEAASAGLPVLASRIYGTVDTVEDEVTGLLVPVHDSAALARSLQRLAGDAALRSRLGEAGRERARRVFSKEVMQDAWRALYERQMAQLPAARRNARNPEAGTP